MKGSAIQAAFVAYWIYAFYFGIGFSLLAMATARFRPALWPVLARLSPIAAGLVLAVSFAHMAFYLWLPNYADYGEPVIPILAMNFLRGAVVYGDWNGGRELVGSNYGPLVFLSQAAMLSVSPTVWASKLTGMLFALASLAVLYLAVVRRLGSRAQSLQLCGLAVVLMAFNLHFWFWNRPDSMLIAFAALGVLAYDRLRPATALVVIAVLAGLCMNLKLFGPIYLTPLALACALRSGWRGNLVAVLAGGLLFIVALAAPFTSPAFDPQAYIANVLMMRRQGLIPSAILDSLAYGLLILAPGLVSCFLAPRKGDRLVLAALALAMAVIAVASGKPGGGPLYMMPFIPLSLYLAVRDREGRETSRPEAAAMLSALFLGLLVVVSPIWLYSGFQMAKQLPAGAAAKSRELRVLFARYPGAEMGVSAEGRFNGDEFLRTEKAFQGQVTRFDPVNYADQRLAGVPTSVTYPFLDGCKVPAWILLRGVGRFTGEGYGPALFDDHGRRRFDETHELIDRTEHFEVWGCARPRPAGGGAP